MSIVGDEDIKKAVNSILKPESLKTAMVIYLVGETFNNTDSVFLDRIEGIISEMISEDRVVLYGELSKWRNSELSSK